MSEAAKAPSEEQVITSPSEEKAPPAVQTVSIEEHNKSKTANVEILEKYKNTQSELSSLKAELDDMKRGQAKNAPDLEKTKTMYEGLLDTSNSTISTLKDELDQLKVFGKVKNVAAKNGAINPEIIEMMVRKQLVKDDKGNYIIKDNTMNPDTRNPFTLEELTIKILNENSYLVKPSGNAGAGSSASTGAAGSTQQFTRAQVKSMTVEEYSKNEPAILKQMAAGTL